MLIIRGSNFINTASGIVTLCKWPSDVPDMFHVHVSSNVVLIIRGSNCINTASGIVSICKWPSGTADGHLQRVTIPDAVLIKFDLLMMSKTLL